MMNVLIMMNTKMTDILTVISYISDVIKLVNNLADFIELTVATHALFLAVYACTVRSL